MKKSIIVLATLGVVGMGGRGLVAGQNPNPAMKVAVVDFQKAINETDDGKKAEAALNASLAEKKKKFDILKSELDTMRQDFEKQRLVLTGKPLQEKQEALQKKLMEVEQTGMGYEQDLGNKKSEALKKIVMGLQEVVTQIGAQDKFDFIFEKSQGGVLYTSGAEDITDRVVKAYNAHPHK